MMHMMPNSAGAIAIAVLLVTCKSCASGSSVIGRDRLLPAPVHLRVEGLEQNVAVISDPFPRFSFLHGMIGGASFGVTQVSYRIIVADADTNSTELLWDSGEVLSANCSQIVYGAGNGLVPFTRYKWNVTWTSSDGMRSAPASARFETGPISPSDWQDAGWLNGTKLGGAGAVISMKNQFRNDFDVPVEESVVFARIYVAAMGCAHVEVNGRVPMPDRRGICPWPVFSNSARYMSHDITDLIVPGRNALGMIAGYQNGRWTNIPQAIVLVVLRISGRHAPIFALSSGSTGWMGTEPYVTTSTAWDATINWTMQEEGWSAPGFTPGPHWTPVTAGSTSGPEMAVSARALAMPLSTELGRVKPVSVRKLLDGDFLYTFPKNFVGTIEFSPLPLAQNGSSLTVLLGEWLGPPPPPPPPPPQSGRCGLVSENEVLLLECPEEKVIDEIIFASWGTPILADSATGCAAGFKYGICPKTGRIGNGTNSLTVVQKFCINQTSCAIPATLKNFDENPTGPFHDPCHGVVKHLAAEVHCSGDPPGASCKGSCYNDPTGPTLPPSPPTPPSDLFYPKISGSVQQYENHVLRAGNNAPITTLFCWHGFQYVRVTPGGNTSFTGDLDAIVALEIHTNVSETGSLTFGGGGDPAAEDAAEILTHINQMILQSQRSNIGAYMPTDCPTREKHGWMGDALDASEQALYNFDIAPVHQAFLQTIEDNQNPTSGDVKFVVPKLGQMHAGCADIAWTSAYPQIAAMQHQYLGDIRTLERRWPSLVRYQEHLITNATNSTDNPHVGLAVCDTFNDWLCGNGKSCCTVEGAPDCPVGPEMGGFSYVLGLRAMSQIATILGNSSAAARYDRLARVGTEEFHSFFYNTSVGRYGGDTGAIQSLSLPALKIHSAPTEVYPNIVKTVADNLIAINYTMNVGAVTSKIIFNMLSENGLHETALRTAINTNQPSIGHWWKAFNATTCYESFWASPNVTPGTAQLSLNHIFLCGGIGHWMWKHLVGITPGSSGFATVSLRPRIHDSIGPRSVGGQFLSPKGMITSSWRTSGKGSAVELSVNLPIGVEGGTIVVPKPTKDGVPSSIASVTLEGLEIWDGNKLVGNSTGIRGAWDSEEGVVFNTTNGKFEFVSTAL